MTNNLDLKGLCESFKQAYRSGAQPKIETFLKRSPASSRADLLRELLLIELSFRGLGSPPPEEAEYHARFPDDESTVSEAFRLIGGSRPATGVRSGDFETAPYQASAGETLVKKGTSVTESKNDREPDGKRFGRYQLLKELGRGGMGAVYLAHDAQLNRKVALKIPTFRDSGREDMMTRFYREARAAAALRDPGICPVYDVGEIDGQAFIAMAFIDGRSLRDYTKSGKPQDPEKTVRVIRKLAMAMSEAHAAGIVHRDLKPANIMMEKGRRPVIMDFGLAYSTTEVESRVTGTGAILGTPTYMSPEQAMGDTVKIGPPTDIYSLGVIFYEMLAGRVPFEGNVTAVLTQIATATAKPLAEYGLGIDPKLDQIVSRMMAKRISDRFGSMDEVVVALTTYLQEGMPEGDELEVGQAASAGDDLNGQSLQPLTAASSDVDGNSGGRSFVEGPTDSKTNRGPGAKKTKSVDSASEHFAADDSDDLAGDCEVVEISEDVLEPQKSDRRHWPVSKSTNGSRSSRTPFVPLLLGGGVAGVVILAAGFFLLQGFSGEERATNSIVESVGVERALSAPVSSDNALGPENGNQPAGSDGDADREVASLTPAMSPNVPVQIGDSPAPTKPEPDPSPVDAAAPLAKEFDPATMGQLAPLDVRTAPRPDHLPQFRFPVRAGQPLSDWAMVSRPSRVNKVLSWSIEPRRSRNACGAFAAHRDGLVALGDGVGRVRLFDAEMRLVRIHAEQEAAIYSVAFSPDGAWLAACAEGHSVEEAARPETQEPPGRVLVWDVRSGQKVFEYATRIYNTPLAWSPESRELMVGVELLSLQTGSVRRLETLGGSPTLLAWSPGGDRLAAVMQGEAGRGTLRIYDLKTDRVIREIPDVWALNGVVSPVDWSADGRWLAFVGLSREVRLHETVNFTLERTLPQPDVLWLQFSPDSTRLLCSTEPKGSTAYDTRTWQPVASDPELGCGGGPIGVASAWLSNGRQIVSHRQLGWWGASGLGFVTCAKSDGSQLATASDFANSNGYYRDNLIQIWDGGSGRLVSDFHVDLVYAIERYLLWQPNGSQLALLERRDGTQATALRLLDPTTGKVVHQLEGHTGKVWQVVWSPDGKHLASVGEDSTCRIWDAATGQQVALLQHSMEQCWLTWSPDGKRIACASPFSDVAVWDTKTWQLQRAFRTVKRTFGKPTSSSSHCPFGFLKDSESLFVMDNADGFEIANIRTGALLDAGKAASYGGLGGSFGLAWSPDFKAMFSGGGASTGLRLFVPGQALSRLIRSASKPTWLSDSRRLVSGDGFLAPITGYDSRTGRRLGVLIPFTSSPEMNGWAMIGPDGNSVISPGASQYLAVTAILEDGRSITLTLEEFEEQYGWKNDPEKARFLTLN